MTLTSFVRSLVYLLAPVVRTVAAPSHMAMMRIVVSLTNEEESATATTTMMAAPLSKVRDAGQERARVPLPVKKKKLERQFGCCLSDLTISLLVR